MMVGIMQMNTHKLLLGITVVKEKILYTITDDDGVTIEFDSWLKAYDHEVYTEKRKKVSDIVMVNLNSLDTPKYRPEYVIDFITKNFELKND